MLILLTLYSFVLVVVCILAAPMWIAKMRSRGGWGSGLTQRLGVHNNEELTSYRGADYYHAVSVGEVVMALKVIKQIQATQPEYQAVIAVTTATGQQVAKTQAEENTLIIYAPLDLPFLFNAVFPIIEPKQIILVDSELWPNLLHYAYKHSIPVRIINGRISPRSFERFEKFKWFIAPLLRPVLTVCTDGELQVSQWHQLGIPEDQIYDVGSLKFDFQSTQPLPPRDFTEQLASLPPTGQPIIMLTSTHPGEELLLTKALQTLTVPHRLLIAPRHAERRETIKSDLQSLGYQVLKRSDFAAPEDSHDGPIAFLIDTTGELASLLPLVDIAVIGKSWLKKGGQNPFETASLGIPTIAGPHMDNFAPLWHELVERDGAVQVANENQLTKVLEKLLHSPFRAQQIGTKGQEFLQTKMGAAEKTAKALMK